MSATATEAKKILIIEDDADMQQIYRSMFQGSEDKYVITIEGDASVILPKITGDDFDLIILDIIMEPMSGDSFFVDLRKGKGIETLPVLIVSVLTPDVLGFLREINHVDFLKKPITKENLFKRIDAMLGAS